MSEIRDMATAFEAVKIAMTQDKNGHILKLAINPADTPEELMRDLVGQRYQVALVRVGDDDQPVESKTQAEGAHCIKLAATLCNNTMFQSWLVDNGMADAATSDAADAGLKDYLGISSKKEFRTNSKARQELMNIRDRFQDHIRQNARLRTR